MVQKKASVTPATKTETVTLRLDPKTRFGLELLARKQYRTLSSVVEWAINNALRHEDEGISQLDSIWDVDDADRLVKLALIRPDLLNYEEQLIWKIISETPLFWKGNYVNKYWAWKCTISSAVYECIRQYYPKIIAAVRGEISPSTLPAKQIKESSSSTDDEIPF